MNTLKNICRDLFYVIGGSIIAMFIMYIFMTMLKTILILLSGDYQWYLNI